MKLLPALFSLLLAVSSVAHAADAQPAVRARVDAELPRLLALSQHLHANPEISFQEVKTAARVADELKQAGFDVTTQVGGHGVVGVLKNGPGPTVLVRTDLDGLPVLEETGLPYASKARTKDDQGNDVPTMHACAHDIHMTSFIGTARVLATLRDRWSGTLVFIGQPAEERVGGAKKMLADGLYTRFPRPDFCLALHAASDLPAGMNSRFRCRPPKQRLAQRSGKWICPIGAPARLKMRTPSNSSVIPQPHQRLPSTSTRNPSGVSPGAQL